MKRSNPTVRDGSRDYAATFALALASTAVTVGAVATLARALDPAAFLEFTVVNRYLGFLALLANLGMAFAFIRHGASADEARARAVAATGMHAIGIALVPVGLLWLAYAAWRSEGDARHFLAIALAGSWIASQACYHLSAPVARWHGQLARYLRLTLVTHLLAPLLGLLVAAASGHYATFFVVWALVSLGAQLAFWPRGPRSRAAGERRALIGFAASRWLDGLVRAALPIAFVLSAELFLGSAAAGAVAVVYLLAKSVESLLQPLVVAAMFEQRGPDLGPSLAGAWILAALIGVGVFLLHRPVALGVALLLGPEHAALAEEAWIVLLGSGALVALSLLRSRHDNRHGVSPMVWVNAAALLAAPALVAACASVSEIALAILALQILRLLAYSLLLACIPGDAPLARSDGVS